MKPCEQPLLAVEHATRLSGFAAVSELPLVAVHSARFWRSVLYSRAHENDVGSVWPGKPVHCS